MSTMTAEREAFERWLIEGDTNPEPPPRDKHGRYVEQDVRYVWNAWQARAALTQPAQAVDVPHVHELIAQYWDLAYAEGKEGRTTDTAAGDAQRVLGELTRAISGEKAGLAGEWEAAFHAQRAAAMRSHTVCYETMLAHPEVAELGDDGRLHDAIHNILRVDGPASPAPDKEGL